MPEITDPDGHVAELSVDVLVTLAVRHVRNSEMPPAQWRAGIAADPLFTLQDRHHVECTRLMQLKQQHLEDAGECHWYCEQNWLFVHVAQLPFDEQTKIITDLPEIEASGADENPRSATCGHALYVPASMSEGTGYSDA